MCYDASRTAIGPRSFSRRKDAMKNRIITFLFSMLFLTGAATGAAAQAQCLRTSAEATVMNGDRASARLEAFARAKWAAVEQTAGATVKVQSLVSNFRLVEDAVITKTKGAVTSGKILNERLHDGMLTVDAEICVDPQGAKEAVSDLALNNAVTLFIPARKPGRQGDEYAETNILSETLLGRFIAQGYTVVDAAPAHPSDAAAVEKAVRSGSTLTVRSLMTGYLSNLMIIGSMDYTLSTAKGESIGYGLAMPFNAVTARLTWRVVARNDKTGNLEILAAGADEAKGLANSVEDAAARAMKVLADRLFPVLLEAVGRHIQGSTRKITVEVNGVADLTTMLEVKSFLQNLVWVSQVEESGLSTFVVSYPENPLYLANSMEARGVFRVRRFSPYALAADYLRPAQTHTVDPDKQTREGEHDN